MTPADREQRARDARLEREFQSAQEREFRRARGESEDSDFGVRRSSRGGIPWWWPMVPQIVGLGGVIYEVGFDRLDRPWIMVGCVTLAIGGKAADVLREVLRG